MAASEIVGVKVTSIVLCGGKERRFGSNKALAMVAGKRAIDRVIERLEPISDLILVVTSPEKANLAAGGRTKVLVDRYPGKGPLGGIYTGLIEAQSAKAIVVGCDMPFLNTQLLKKMVMMADGFDAVVPRLDGGMIEPLHAVYARSCAPEMKEHLDNDRLSITQLIRELKVRYMEKEEYLPLDPDMLSFFNINYPADLERANRLADDGANVPRNLKRSAPLGPRP
jgi:molybdopterin-guanine dinucleotide biosynthesis protein A